MVKGYRREAPRYRLKFEDEEFDGLEVVARSLPLREFLEMQKLQAKAADDPEAAGQVIEELASLLVSWNVEDGDGKPLPATYASLAEMDFPFTMAIITAWMEAVSSVPNLSSGNSNGGETSPERSIPMEVR